MKINLIGRTSLSLAALILVASGPIAAQILTKNTPAAPVHPSPGVQLYASDEGTNHIPLDPAAIVPTPAAAFSSSTEKVANVFGAPYQSVAPQIRRMREVQPGNRAVALPAGNASDTVATPSETMPAASETRIPVVSETVPGSTVPSKWTGKVALPAAPGARRFTSQSIPEPGTASLLMSSLTACACFVGVRRKK